MPGRHVTDQQMRLFMTHRQTHTVSVAAAKAGVSQATGYRLQADGRRILVEGPTSLASVVGLMQGLTA